MTYEEKCYTCVEFKDKINNCNKPFYITTIICEKLGYSEDCAILNILINFRDNVMQKDLRYCKLLFEYDMICPKLAEMIKEDSKDNNELWTVVYNFYLSIIANFILEEKYDKAVERYTEMLNDLKDYYGLNEMAKNYDMQQGGHGKVKLLELKEEI